MQIKKTTLYRLKEFSKKIRGKHQAAKEGVDRPILDSLLDIICNNKKKYNWSDVVGALVGIIGLMAYCISPALAQYRGTQAFLVAVWIVIGIMVLILIWELLCIIICSERKKMWELLHSVCVPLKKHWRSTLLGLFLLALFSGMIICFFNPPIKTEYYADITEIYGVPAGLDEISKNDLKGRAGYWKIVDYSWAKRRELTFVEPYGQLEVMKENSSAYSMSLFPATARIVCKYSTDQKEYRKRLDERTFTTATEAGILRTPVYLSFFSSSGKLLLRLEQNGYGRAKITDYSSDEMPQLPGSTLLRMPDDQTAGNGITSLQIETTYRPDGLPESRRLSPYIYNQYGVNGEQYTYDEEGRLSTLCYLDVNGKPVCNKLGIMSIMFSHSKDSSAIRYFSDQDFTEKTEGFYGVFCEKLQYDKFGNLVERKELNRSEDWGYDKDGVHLYEYDYEGGRLTREKFSGRESAPVESSRFHTSAISYNLGREGGNDILSICYDAASVTAESEPTPEPPSALNDPPQLDYDFEDPIPMSIESREDDLYLPVLLRTTSPLFASNDEQNVAPTNGQDILEMKDDPVRSYAILRYSINPRNRRVAAVRYCDRTGEAAGSEEGYAEKQFCYDNQARVTLESYFDAEKNPYLIADGYASVRRRYNKNDRIEEIIYLGLDGMPSNVPTKGYASVRYDYSSLDLREIIRKSFYDPQGELTRSSLGYAVEEQRYSLSGLLIQEAYFNKDDAPTYRLDYRVAEIRYEYSDSGDLVLVHYRDAKGAPVNRADKGYARLHQVFDRGQVVQRSYEGYVNHSLQPVPDRTTGATVIKYRYQNGQIQREDYYRPGGIEHILRQDTGYAAYEYEYEDGRLVAQHYYGTDGEPVLRGDYGYAHRRISHNELGQIEKVRYTGVEDEPIISTYYHCAGFNYQYDDQGNQSYICYVDLNDELLLRSDLGYAQLKRVYQKGKIVKEWYMDAEGNPVLCKDGGYAYLEQDFDPSGNWVEGRYYDTNGNLTLRNDRGYAIAKFTYNNGHRVSERFYDTDAKTPVISTYYHCAGFDYGYDECGNKNDIRYIGLDGKPLIRKDKGFAQIKSVYSNGKVISESYFDVDGKPIPYKEHGYVRFEDDYDEYGNCIESRYYDRSNNLTLRSDESYAVGRYVYNDFGDCISIRYYGTDGKTPIINTKYFCAGFDYECNDLGNRTKIRYIDLDGKLMVRSDLGYAQMNKIYNDQGKVIGEEYFDVKGDPAVYKDQGYVAYRSDYENGLWTATRYYGANGQLTPCKKGYAVLKNEYDEYGRRTLQQYYDTDEKTPVVSSEYHCAAIRYGYDERGNTNYYGYLGLDGEFMIHSDYGCAQVRKSFNDRDELEWEDYLDAEGQAVVYKDRGYAIVRYEYDKAGQKTSVRYYGTDGKTPAINTYYHCAGFDYGYDEQGDQVDIRYIDLNGELMIRSDLGYAQVKSIYSNGETISELYFDVDGSPIPHKERGYVRFEDDFDENGKCVESRFYDAFGNLTLRKDRGYAVSKSVYDDFGHCISTRYYGTDGKTPIINTYYHCAGFDYECDALGNWIKIQYIGLDGKLMIRNDLGYAQVDRTFNEMGRLVGEAFYDVDGNPTIYKNRGYASYQDSYDANGNCTESKYYDAQKNLVKRWDMGYAVIRSEYNDFNQCKGEYYYDIDGETPIISSRYHCAGMLYDYDENGNQTSISYIDTDKNLMVRSDLGYARVEKNYDSTGQLIGEEYFDARGERVACNDGYASYKSLYENGLCTEEAYFDIYGDLVVNPGKGYAVVKNTYNDYGQIETERFYNTDGETPMVSSQYHCIGYNYEYDERGNQTYIWYIEPDNTITVHSGTDLLNFLVYDDYYHIVQDDYYIFEDDVFKMVPRKDFGYASVENTYEGKNWVETIYRDEKGQPIINQEKDYAILTRGFNDQGQLIKVSYYDKERELTECKDGYAIVEYKYDESGNESSRIYYNAFREEIER